MASHIKESTEISMKVLKDGRGKIVNFFAGKLIDREVAAQREGLVRLAKDIQESQSSIERELQGFRRMTATTRDLSPIEQDRMIEIATYLFQRNPLAKRLIEMIKGHVIGTGPTWKANDEAVSDVISNFWYDPANNMDLYTGTRARELSLFGELILPAWVSKDTGKVRLGYIDPEMIKDIEVNKFNTQLVEKVILKSAVAGENVEMKVINIDRDPQSPTFGRLIGVQENVGDEKNPVGCFYFRINNLSNAKRGISDLMVVADWLDALDNIIFNLAEREALMKAFIWDVTLSGEADDSVVQKRSEAIEKNPPYPGSVNVHNDKETWEPKAPDIGSKGTTEVANLLLMMIHSGSGLPGFWFGQGDDVNRATAVEMGSPTMKMLQERQLFMKAAVEYMFDFVIDQAFIAGTLPNVSEEVEKDMRKFDIMFPPVSEEDTAEASTTLNNTTSSLVVAEANDWITNETAAKVYANLVSRLGVPVDAEAEIKALSEKSGKKGNVTPEQLGTILAELKKATAAEKTVDDSNAPAS